MRTVVMFGAGQMGRMLYKLLGSDYRVIAFADNNPNNNGKNIMGIPIKSPEAAVKLNPDLICLGVIDDERGSQMREQLQTLGYTGQIIDGKMLKVFDARVATMRLLAEQIYDNNIAGNCLELGVYKGEFARLINLAFPDKKLYLLDTFEGFYESDVTTEESEGLSRAKVGEFSDTSAEDVYNSMPIKENVVIKKGFFPDAYDLLDERYCFISMDVDLYEPTKAGLDIFWKQLSPGGVIMLHDYNSGQFRGVKKAADEFLSTVDDASLFPICDLHGSVAIKRQG